MIFIGLLLSIQSMAADPVCLRGSPKNDVFTKQLAAAKDPLTVKFRKKSLGAKQETEAGWCLACKLGEAKDPLAEAAAQSKDLMAASRPHIKNECIQASLKRDGGAPARLCAGSNKESKEDPCVSQEVADYISFAVNEAMACVASTSDLEPRWMLKKLNHDSSFQFWTANEDRLGLGRLSAGRRRDIAGWIGTRASGSKVTVPRRSAALERLAKSKDPACEPFQKILAKDKPSSANGKGDECAFQSLGTGLARNLIYTLNAFADLRDEDVVPELKTYNAELANDRELVQQLTMVADSEFGLGGVHTFLNGERIKPETKATDLLKKLQDHAVLKANLDSHRDMMKKLDPAKDSLSDAEKDGSTCVGY